MSKGKEYLSRKCPKSWINITIIHNPCRSLEVNFLLPHFTFPDIARVNDTNKWCNVVCILKYVLILQKKMEI